MKGDITKIRECLICKDSYGINNKYITWGPNPYFDPSRPSGKGTGNSQNAAYDVYKADQLTEDERYKAIHFHDRNHPKPTPPSKDEIEYISKTYFGTSAVTNNRPTQAPVINADRYAEIEARLTKIEELLEAIASVVAAPKPIQ